ncbi:MAG: ATP-dependent zinc metalloprotease FtsH [Oscillospiraceae bacterium]|nr:ATP-dependent zinc metalloprotease FtsH [Oscillospiraceae bacterium]
MKLFKRSGADNKIYKADPQKAGGGEDRKGESGAPAGKAPKKFNVFHIIIVIFLINFALNLIFGAVQPGMQIEYSQFIRLVEGGYIGGAQLEDERILVSLRDGADLDEVAEILDIENRGADQARQPTPGADSVFYVTKVDDPMLVERLSGNGVDFYKPAARASSPILGFITSWIVPMLIMYLVFNLIARSVMKKMGKGGSGGMGGMGGMGGLGGIFGAGKSKAKEYKHEKNVGVTFADVAGQDEAKESLAELSDILKHPEKYSEIGAKQPKGALLVGPPGTGKTLLARALAGEAGVPFYSITGSEFVEMFVGVGASRVRDMFENAKKNAPCIIFIDEIDAIGKSRDSQVGGNDEREQTLNQLLSEMDGFDGKKGIVVLAATNRPEILDKALLRPGRFDRRIVVDKPDLPGREAILKVHANKVRLAGDVDLHELALATSGATGADLANMINEGALLAVKGDRKTVRQGDLMEAVEVVIAGKEKKDRVMSPKEREMVAYHEVGHALVGAMQKGGQPVQKITIVPRTMGSLGYTMSMPEEERYLPTKGDIIAQITTLLGGRAAEIVQFGEMTTGAANDIERATALARGMVTQFGMSDRFGPMSLERAESRYLDGRGVAACSAQTEAMVDEEVRQVLADCQDIAVGVLQEYRGAMGRISGRLLEKENITGAEFMELLDLDAMSA